MSAVYDFESDSIFVSAYELCSYVLRGGDINSNGYNLGNKNGHAIVSHKMNTKKPNISDAFVLSCLRNGITINVYTNDDGISKNDNGIYTVEKIVRIPYSLDDIDNGELEISIAAIICSSYIVYKRLGGAYINARLIFIQEEDGESKIYTQKLEREELEIRFDNLLDMFAPFAKLISNKGKGCKSQLASLKFPFPKGVRPAQRDFILESFRAIKSRKRLIAQAPTGIGKTMGSLYPSLKSIGEGLCDKVFYFTGKNTTAYSVVNAIEIMKESIPDFRTIVISSKERCCKTFGPKQHRKCNPKDCKRAVAFYDKINVALLELLENHKIYTKEIIDEVADKYSLCAYELSLELSEWCDLIVCDYNYLFDLQVYLRRYFTLPDANYVFLIDEAHNLIDRAREMYSSTIEQSTITELKEKFNAKAGLSKACDILLKKFEKFNSLAMAEKREFEGQFYGFYMTSKLPDDILDGFFDVVKECEKLFSKNINDDLLMDVYYQLKHFVKVCEIFDKRFTMYIESANDNVKVRLLCLDASKLLDLSMKKGISTILFSATLSPQEYFADILGCEKGELLTLPSPFDKSNLCLLGVHNISTRYDDREKNYSSVANVIRSTVAGKQGNYIVYFPSYNYLEKVKDVFAQKYPNIGITVQKKSMSENAKKEFLDSFDAKKEGTLVGFCVLGGSFSEGIDLRGERLIGAIIVGVGLPTISSELNIIKEYFDNTRENGYAYAYTYPGMIKVLQAAGRVIRSEDERGVVVLIDDRFATQEYKDLMPENWSHMKFLSSAKDLYDEVTRFWAKK